MMILFAGIITNVFQHSYLKINIINQLFNPLAQSVATEFYYQTRRIKRKYNGFACPFNFHLQ